MKITLVAFAILLIFSFSAFTQEQTAYFEIGKTTESFESTSNKINAALQNSGFKVIGQYKPGNSDDLMVICYTHPDLEKIALDFNDRGALAATLKVGLKKDANKIEVSMLNPMYLFYAYFVEDIEKHEKELLDISENAKEVLNIFDTDFNPFGGSLDKKKLQKYHYKVMMPYFKNADELNKFESFDAGVKTIRNNLNDKKGNTSKVYELIYPEQKVAVFGVGLLNPEDGESKFLPIIGDDHIAAMPYEVIIQNNKATILPGRYRIALHWPELTMGTFMKIMSTPGDIKTTLKSLTE